MNKIIKIIIVDPVHDFLDRKRSVVEAFYIIVFILAFSQLTAYYFDPNVNFCLGIIIGCVGIYGMIRKHIKNNKK